MAATNASDREHQIKYSEAIAAARQRGLASFQSWFDQADSVERALVRGHWDFALHILTPKVCALITEPERRVALEIGYGGGRLLNAACAFFGQVIGIDVHAEQEMAEQFLRAQGKSNFRLLRTSGREIGVEPASVDFIYSFIVLQHLPTVDVFRSYLRESHRALRPGGVAQLYFGRFSKLARRQRIRHFLRGYAEIPNAPVNHTSLVLRVGTVKRMARASGFEVVDSGASHKGVPDGYPRGSGGQSYVTLRKLA